MKFKVGDKVRLVKTDDEIEAYKNYIGKTFTIKGIREEDGEYFAELAETYDIIPYLKNLELVNKKYTYENLKQSPIGTKITFESGNIIIKVKENYYCNNLYFRNDNDLKGLKDTISLNKIIKIEEPIYTTVYEKKEILDEAEKRYLSNFIRPFRDNVKYIKKTHYRYEKSKIEICVNGYIEEANISDTYYTFLPAFSTNEMYNGMTLEKEYTLEELGL
jgi:hypothetical protein